MLHVPLYDVEMQGFVETILTHWSLGDLSDLKKQKQNMILNLILATGGKYVSRGCH